MIDTPEFSTVLMAIKWPGQQSPRIIDKTSSHSDVLPLILKNAGIEAGFDMDGSADLDATPRFVHYFTNGGFVQYSLNGEKWMRSVEPQLER